MMNGLAFSQSHADFLVFFFSFGPWITAHDSYQSRRRSMVLLRSISPTPGSLVSILVFDVPSQKCFALTGDRHSCQASNIGSAWEKRKEIKKNTRGRSRSSQKMPGDGAEFSKRPPGHRRSRKPQSLNIWRQIFQKRGKQKTLLNGHYSGKKRDSFELRTKIVPRELRPKHFGVAESLPRPQLVIHPWRIYPSYGHWDDHFDDGYIRHMALNGLKV